MFCSKTRLPRVQEQLAVDPGHQEMPIPPVERKKITWLTYVTLSKLLSRNAGNSSGSSRSKQGRYTQGSLLPKHSPETCSWVSTPTSAHEGHDEGAYSRSTLLQHAPGAKLPRLHQRFLAKKYVAQQNFCSRVLHGKKISVHTRELAPETDSCNRFAPGACSIISNQFDMREQNTGAKVLLRNIFFR